PCFVLRTTATPSLYSLSLHDALPISFSITISYRYDVQHGTTSAARHNQGRRRRGGSFSRHGLKGHQRSIRRRGGNFRTRAGDYLDRKSTRLNSSHVSISYAVFCLKKK